MKSMKFALRAASLAMVSALFAPSAAYAGFTCAGPVSATSIDTVSGDVLTNVGDLSWTRLCNVHLAANGVSVEACKITYATLLTAQTTGKSVVVYYNAATQTPCNQITAWNYLAGFYFLTLSN